MAPSAAPVSLAQMLARRDARRASQQALLERFACTLVQLTLVNPGAVKDTVASRLVFDEGQKAVQALLDGAAYPVLAQQGGYFETGAEMLWAVQAPAPAAKRTLLALEDTHPLGRLWDVDVLDASGASLSRSQLGLPARSCLVCEEPAHACARSGAHPLAELQRVIQDKVHAFFQPTTF